MVRLGMAFQFQSVAAVAPLLGTNFGVNLADIGLMAVIAAWCGHSTGFGGADTLHLMTTLDATTDNASLTLSALGSS